MASSIKDSDKGYKATLERFAGTVTIRAGLFEADGSQAKEQGHHAETVKIVETKNGQVRAVKRRVRVIHESDSLTLAQVAEWNEFGTSRIPDRSFIRGFVDENESDIMTWIARATERVAKGAAPSDAFEIVGLRLATGMQKRIAQGVPPPNAASTIARKGSSKPLIDTGQLRSAISYKVEIK